MPTCGTETHPFSSHPTIDTTTQARAAPGVHIGQPAPKTTLKASHKARNRPEEFLVSDGPDRRERGSAIVTNRHAMSRFYDFGQPFPSQGGHAEKKSHLGSGLDQRDKATPAVSPTQLSAFPN